MVKLELTDTSLVLHITGMDVVLSLRTTFTIPLSHIKRVVVSPPDAHYDQMKGLRMAGGYLPGKFATGLFWITGGAGDEAQEAREHAMQTKTQLQKAGDRFAKARDLVDQALTEIDAGIYDLKLPETKKYWAFYEVHDPQQAIGIDLENQKITRVVVQVSDETKEAAAARINAAITAHHR